VAKEEGRGLSVEGKETRLSGEKKGVLNAFRSVLVPHPLYSGFHSTHDTRHSE